VIKGQGEGLELSPTSEGTKKEEVAGELCIMRSFITYTLHQILLG
jgi:hypothetical protein